MIFSEMCIRDRDTPVIFRYGVKRSKDRSLDDHAVSGCGERIHNHFINCHQSRARHNLLRLDIHTIAAILVSCKCLSLIHI